MDRYYVEVKGMKQRLWWLVGEDAIQHQGSNAALNTQALINILKSLFTSPNTTYFTVLLLQDSFPF